MRRRVLLLASFVLIALLGWATFTTLRPTPPLPIGEYRVGTRTVRLDSATAWLWLPHRADSARTKLPLLVFSPGMGVAPGAYASLLRGIASHGYVVLAVAHPRPLPDSLPDIAGRIADDLVATLDRLQRSDVPLDDIDLGRIGVFGHSLGGAAAALACRSDPRYKAGIDFDGTVFGDVTQFGVPRPFMLFMADLGLGDRANGDPGPFDPQHDRLRMHEDSLFEHTPTAYWVTMRGLRHMAFADESHLGLLDRVAQATGIYASGDDTKALAIRFTHAFFRRYLGEPGRFDRALSEVTASRVRLVYHWRAAH